MSHPIVKIKKIGLILVFVSLSQLFVQCEQSHFYQQQESVKNNWDKDTALEFDFEIKDTAMAYDFFLLSRNNNSYEYSNLYLITEFKNPGGEKFKDTLQYFLSYPDGEWIGKGNSLKELYLLYRENINFSDTGKYELKVWHGMRENQLVGIEDLSLIVDKKTRDE